MNEIPIFRVCVGELQSAILRSWAELYCSIWKEPPWSEDFWTPENVASDILKEIKKPCAEAYLTLVNSSEITGFTWGYEVTESELQEIAGTNTLNFLFANQKRVFYIDELGVDLKFRKHGIGEKLSRALIDAAHKMHSITRIILRTDIKAQDARHLYKKLGFQDLKIQDAGHPNRTYWLLDVE